MQFYMEEKGGLTFPACIHAQVRNFTCVSDAVPAFAPRAVHSHRDCRCVENLRQQLCVGHTVNGVALRCPYEPTTRRQFKAALGTRRGGKNKAVLTDAGEPRGCQKRGNLCAGHVPIVPHAHALLSGFMSQQIG